MFDKESMDSILWHPSSTEECAYFSQLTDDYAVKNIIDSPFVTAEIIEKYVSKGKEIAIEGKLTHRSYDDKDGNKRFITEVIANEILLIGK